MPTVLATGGLGFIGSHTCSVLLEDGMNVLAVDSLINSDVITFEKVRSISGISADKKKGKFTFKKGDVRDVNFLRGIFNEYILLGEPINSVIHFAGLKAVGESVEDPLKYWDLNLNSTLSLLKVMSEFNCKNLIFSSSATVYKPEILLNKKVTEDSLLFPINPYGNTKFTIEKILSDLSASDPDSWKIANLRYFNPVGAHESGLIGENPKDQPNNLLPALIKVINKEKKELLIFGRDWPTKDGTCVRDFVHVMDLAEAHVAALRFLFSNEPQVININIGTGLGTTVLELVQKFIETNKCILPYKFVERRPGDAPYSVADNSKALSILDWKPKRSIEDICKDSWRWNFSNR